MCNKAAGNLTCGLCPVAAAQVGLRDSLLSSAVMLYRKMVAGGVESVVISPWEVRVAMVAAGAKGGGCKGVVAHA